VKSKEPNTFAPPVSQCAVVRPNETGPVQR